MGRQKNHGRPRSEHGGKSNRGSGARLAVRDSIAGRALLYFGVGWCVGLLGGGVLDWDHILAMAFPWVRSALGGRPLHVVDTACSGAVLLVLVALGLGWLLWHGIGVVAIDGAGQRISAGMVRWQ